MPSKDSDQTAARRARLRAWINDHFNGSRQLFADYAKTRGYKLDLTELSSLQTGNKSFGEKKAKQLELAVGMPTGHLVDSLDELSQLRRLDFEKIAASITVLREYLKLVKRSASRINDPVLLKSAYEVVEEFGAPVTKANVIDLAERIRDRLRAENGDGQRGEVHRAGKTVGAAK